MLRAHVGVTTFGVIIMSTNMLSPIGTGRMTSIRVGDVVLQFPAPSQEVIDRVVDRNGDFLLGVCCVAAGVLLGAAIANAR